MAIEFHTKGKFQEVEVRKHNKYETFFEDIDLEGWDNIEWPKNILRYAFKTNG